jgi:hypothetical protein
MKPHSQQLEPLVPFTVHPWTEIHTEGWLTEYPLPNDFVWPDRYDKPRHCVPTYKIKGGYGKWLHETPYFPGLFEEIHRILALAPNDQLLSPEWLAAELDKRRPRGEQQAFL